MHDGGEGCHDDAQRCQRVSRVCSINQRQGCRHGDIGMHVRLLVVEMKLTKLLDNDMIIFAGQEFGVSGIKQRCVCHHEPQRVTGTSLLMLLELVAFFIHRLLFLA